VPLTQAEVLECFAASRERRWPPATVVGSSPKSGAKQRCALNKERKTMNNTIKIVLGVSPEDESGKLADPKNEESAVAPEQPKKQPIRVEITLMPTYKPSRK
jgi:hypothetical protein